MSMGSTPVDSINDRSKILGNNASVLNI
jgi:hypothetical protein